MASNVTESLSFYLGNPVTKQPNIILQGDATATEGKLRLTKVDEHGVPVRGSLGRALHINPVHIWDSETSNVASFFTCFSFSIHALNAKKTADGLAFFLAPMDDQPKSGGGYLGLFNRDEKSQQLVAVEFDTYLNKSDEIDDPNYLHIGLDVMKIKSRKVVQWGFENDHEAIVYISYDDTSSNQALKTTLVYPSSGKHYSLSSTGVDLTEALPEWVRFGFSAYAGEAETHDVKSWYFASSFGDDAQTLAEPLKKLNPYLASNLNLHFGSGK
ncbi:hypothetical protein PIB30_104035 [Stylosanthes scabra]|uniref:Legume lectin domain-containing protein n=1 Tax=Stylosanthes scabra TaxID=79078 RepID=A0ABU6YWG4_9FABA|nr:hypothetical protein [Stylosanthes scabra]